MPQDRHDRLTRILNSFSKEEKILYDVSEFNDPIAEQTNWGPCFRGGANYRTRRLVHVSDTRIEFKSGCARKTFGCLFMAVGGIVGGMFAMLAIIPELRDWTSILASFAGLLFVGIGFAFNRLGNIPIVFDKTSGYFWNSRKDPRRVVNIKEIKKLQRLDDIHALQIIPETLSGSNSSSYMSYEINLILKDASRVNVIDHGDLKQILLDADNLGKFLNVPVWSALTLRRIDQA